MYGKLNGEGVEYAPINYETEDGNLILNFNKNEQLMTQYGYKMVIEQIPEYDINTQRIYVNKYMENRNSITIVYEVIEIEPTDAQIVNNKLVELEQIANSLNSQLDELNSEIEMNKTEVNKLNSEIKTNKTKVNKLNSEVRDLQTQQVNYDAILSEEVNR